MKPFLIAVLLAGARLSASQVEPARIVQQTRMDMRYVNPAVRVNATVKLEVSLDETGKVTRIKAIEGRPDLIPPAIQNVSQWRFAPATIDGKAVRSVLNVQYNFSFNQ